MAKRNTDRVQLLEGCSRSAFTVHPANWNKTGADAKAIWYFTYRFYDPGHGTERGKQIHVRADVNKYHTLADKRTQMQAALAYEAKQIDERGYNPIREVFMKPLVQATREHVISPDLPLPAALAASQKRLNARLSKSSVGSIRTVLKYVAIAARGAGLDKKPISTVTKANVVVILEEVGQIKGKSWTPNNYNFYRSHLNMLFKELEDVDAIEYNPVTKVPTKATAVKKRAMPTEKQRRDLDKKLKELNYHMWRFMHIYHASGARESEIVQVRTEDVDLKGQTVRYIIRKGRHGTEREILRPIKDTVLHLWKEIIAEAKPGEYLFAYRMKPAAVAINSRQLTRKWRLWVKEKLGIDVDLSVLRHMHITEMRELLSVAEIQKITGHTTPAMIERVYDIEKQRREHEIIRKSETPFAPLKKK